MWSRAQRRIGVHGGSGRARDVQVFPPVHPEQIETTRKALALPEPMELAFIARHPWVTVSAATAAGLLIGAASRRLPDDVGEHARSGAGWAAALGSVALRYGVSIGTRKLVEGLQHRFSNTKDVSMDRKNNGSAMSPSGTEGRLENVKSRAEAAVDTASSKVGRAVDSATSTMGRGLEGASRGVQRAADSVSHAGQYLQDATPSQMGADLADMIRRHPKTAIAVGVGLGFVIARLISR